MIDLFKNVFWYIIRVTCAAVLHVLQYIPRIQEVYDEAVVRNSYMLKYIPDHLKMQEMCDTAARMHSGCEEFRTLRTVTSNALNTPFYSWHGICEKAAEKNTWGLKNVPDHLKTQEMCNEALRGEP